MTREKKQTKLTSGPPKHGCGRGEWNPMGGYEVVLDLKLLWWRLEVWEIPEFTNAFFAFPKGPFKIAEHPIIRSNLIYFLWDFPDSKGLQIYDLMWSSQFWDSWGILSCSLDDEKTEAERNKWLFSKQTRTNASPLSSTTRVTGPSSWAWFLPVAWPLPPAPCPRVSLPCACPGARAHPTEHLCAMSATHTHFTEKKPEGREGSDPSCSRPCTLPMVDAGLQHRSEAWPGSSHLTTRWCGFFALPRLLWKWCAATEQESQNAILGWLFSGVFPHC